jgi:hypothetical protein
VGKEADGALYNEDTLNLLETTEGRQKEKVLLKVTIFNA